MAKLYLRYKNSQIPIFLHAFFALLAYLVWALLVIFLLPLFLTVQVVKMVNLWLARLSNKCQPLCLSDIPFMLDRETDPYLIVTVMKLNGNLEIEKFRSLFQTRILDRYSKVSALKKLKQYITCSFNTYVWMSVDKFNLEENIVLHDSLLTGTEDELKAIFIKLTQERFSPSRPLWKVVVCNTKNSANTYLFSSFHHVLGDGFSLNTLVMKIFDNEPAAPQFRKSGGVMSDIYQRVLLGVMTGPLVLATVLFSGWYNHPFAEKNKEEGRCVAWANGRFDLIKDIKNITKTTVNDVFLTLLSGALTKYLGEKTSSDLPIVISFNSRSYQDLLKTHQTLGNNSSGAFFGLPLGKSPSETLKTIHARTIVLKNSSDGHTFGFIFSKVIGLLPACLGRLAACSLKQHCSLLVTNMPGPTEPLTLHGLNVEYMVATPPLMYDLGISISLFTYNKEVFIAILSRKSVLPDPERLASLFVEQIDELHCTIKKKSH